MIHSGPVWIHHKMFKFKIVVYHTKWRFLCNLKYPYIFLLKSEKLKLMKHFVEGATRNHVETRIPKIIFKPMTESKGKEISHKSLVESLQSSTSVKEQIEHFHSKVKLPADNVNIRQIICKDLEKALQPYFTSQVSVCLVGSSINGLGFRGCDVDLSLQFSAANANRHHVEEKLFSIDETETAKVPVNKVYAAKNQLLTIRKILQELQFQEPLTVIPGRCPILNFSYQSLPCDLSINNRLALHSTNLMLLCGKLDDRFTPLMQVITYWAKHSKLVGGPGRFKTYAIFLLVVYFLQTRCPPVLPSVETIFAKTKFWENLDNWSYDVTKYMKCFERSENGQSVEELLRDFFAFYGNYDFGHVICPTSGRSFERKVFDCEGSFEFNTICVQDPLNPAWNVTTGVSWKHCKNFVKAVVAMWEQFQDPAYWKPRPGMNWGVCNVVDHHYVPEKLVNVKEFALHLPFTPASADHVKYILAHCLDFECQLATDSNFERFPQGFRNTFESRPGLLARWVVAAEDTWLGRNAHYPAFDSSDLDRERSISEAMRGRTEREAFYFLCECSRDGECLLVEFRVLNSDRFVPKLVIFLKDYVPRLMQKLGGEDAKGGRMSPNRSRDLATFSNRQEEGGRRT